MPAQTCLIVVEGPHDIAFVARLLSFAQFHHIHAWDALPIFWQAVVPRNFPVGNDLLARHPVPTFLQNNQGQTVAIRSAVGINRLITSLSDTLNQLDQTPEAIGIVLDADSGESPPARYASLRLQWETMPNCAAATFPAVLGQINAGPPKAGTFILPDNANSGTLEDLLFQGAETNYPQSFQAARDYIATFPKPDLQPNELDDFHTSSGQKKATIAALASVLKPGKAIQVSIQDNRWINAATLQRPDFLRLSAFLAELLS